jgi:general L-amino acid transport system substrate-binding protein
MGANKVKFTPLSAKERFTALTSGEIDILSRNTTWTLSRDADIGLTFVGVEKKVKRLEIVKKEAVEEKHWSGVCSVARCSGA